MSIKRFIPSAGLAIGTTTALGLFMAAMIATEFTPQEKGESLGYEINPLVEDIIIQPQRQAPKLYKKVETPPPPPTKDRAITSKPQERIASVIGAIPDYVTPKLDQQIFKIAVTREEQPLLRVPPIMPSKAERSGHCTVRFDVSPEGAPFNVIALFCTQNLFENPTIKSVQKWKYNPKLIEGRAVSRKGVENRVTYRLTDARGRIIPE